MTNQSEITNIIKELGKPEVVQIGEITNTHDMGYKRTLMDLYRQSLSEKDGRVYLGIGAYHTSRIEKLGLIQDAGYNDCQFTELGKLVAEAIAPEFENVDVSNYDDVQP